MITKPVDSTSPVIFNPLLCGGTDIPDRFREIRRKIALLSFTLQNTLIANYAVGKTVYDESFTLTFAKMTYDTHDASPDVSRHSEVIMKGSTGNPGTLHSLSDRRRPDGGSSNRLADAILVDGAEFRLQKSPVDCPHRLYLRVSPTSGVGHEADNERVRIVSPWPLHRASLRQ